MKSLGGFFSLGALLAGIALLGFGCAHHNETANRNEQYLTGSYLPQDAQRNGPVTNGKNNVHVWDQSDINRTGAATPGQALRQLGETP